MIFRFILCALVCSGVVIARADEGCCGYGQRHYRLFNSKQLSFYGVMDEARNYVLKFEGDIIAGIRICHYLNECIYVNASFG